MRFDELPVEIVVMLSKRCDPFTRDSLRLTSKRIKDVIDLHFKWKPCLESLSVELAPEGDVMFRIRISTCTLYGKEEVQIRLFRTNDERAAILADCLARVSSVRRLHLLGIPLDNVLLQVLVKEFEKIANLNALVLEECTVGLGKTLMSALFTNVNLKSIRIIRCPGAYRIVDEKFIKSASEEFILEGTSSTVAHHNRRRMFHVDRFDENPDYDVTIDQVDRGIQDAFEVINEIEADRLQDPRVRFDMARDRQWRVLHEEVRRLQALRRHLELRDRVEDPIEEPFILVQRQNGPVRQMFGANGLNGREALQRLQELAEDDENEDRDAPFVDPNREMQRLELINLGRVLLAARRAQPVRPRLQHHAPQLNEDPDQSYIFITKQILDFLEKTPLTRFELRNLTANNNVTLTGTVFDNDTNVYWNFGNLPLIKVGDLQELSNLRNIVWTPEPSWLHGFFDRADVYKQFEMKTTDGKKTFLFSTNVR